MKGLETLALRVQGAKRAALELAQWLQGHPKVARVYYPGLQSHPQHALAMASRTGMGGAGAGRLTWWWGGPEQLRAQRFSRH